LQVEQRKSKRVIKRIDSRSLIVVRDKLWREIIPMRCPDEVVLKGTSKKRHYDTSRGKLTHLRTKKIMPIIPCREQQG
jgi:hypothetical protein